MKVTVSIPNVASSVEADLSDYSYQAILNEGRKDAILAMLHTYTDAYGNEYITRELSEYADDLTSEELDGIVSNLWNHYFGGNRTVGQGSIVLANAFNNHELNDLIRDYVIDAVEARRKVYKVRITCTVDRTIYIRAHSSDEIERAIDNCCDLPELMAEGDMNLLDVSIADEHDQPADLDIDDI